MKQCASGFLQKLKQEQGTVRFRQVLGQPGEGLSVKMQVMKERELTRANREGVTKAHPMRRLRDFTGDALIGEHDQFLKDLLERANFPLKPVARGRVEVASFREFGINE